MSSPLRALLRIIQDSVDKIEDSCRHRDAKLPGLDEVLTPQTSMILSDPDVQDAASLITAAAHQLIASVQLPQQVVMNAGCSYYLSASLRTALEVNVVEILREAGTEGLHVKEIASRAGVDHTKLARVMRYLATHHIFKEVTPDVYVNNRLSSTCDTEKTVSELISKPLEKYDGTNGIAALIGHCADEDYKGAAYIVEHLTDPTTAFEDSPDHTPMMLAFGSDAGVWNWLEQPSNKMRFRRFGVAMDGVSKMQPADSILKGFDWGALPHNSVVVDVGGGIGVSSIALVKGYPHLRCIVQDRPQVIEQGQEHCRQLYPEALLSGRLQYHAHDFFDVQPQVSASVFLLKQILHDWSDRYATRILKRLRDAAGPDTKLIIVDSIIPHTCPASSEDLMIPGAEFPSPPSPLLTNLGAANSLSYITDLSMYVHFNGQERTLSHNVELLKGCGWVLEHVFANGNTGRYLSQMVAVPASL